MTGSAGVASFRALIDRDAPLEPLRLARAEDGVGVSVLCPAVVRTRLWRTSRVVRGLEHTDVPPDDLRARTAHAAMEPTRSGDR